MGTRIIEDFVAGIVLIYTITKAYVVWYNLVSSSNVTTHKCFPPPQGTPRIQQIAFPILKVY